MAASPTAKQPCRTRDAEQPPKISDKLQITANEGNMEGKEPRDGGEKVTEKMGTARVPVPPEPL